MSKEQMELSGDWLKKQRVERNITQEALARYVNAAQSSISRWEKEGIPHYYIVLGFQYFFDGWEKNCLRKSRLDEIPKHPQLAPGTWLSWWMETEGVRVGELAEALGVTTRCVYGWMKPDKKISIIAEYAIRKVMKDLGH